ncbi:hypothetical protein COV19_03180 [Candidatus Woesearchaeota archaeon CG10_big_fil_rev_8_21_14_0_10_44_13]|nr:MAG: hypothetical protein COV19_03180 [Candidatus Woesearchaeota archaeon CG10_big_fil_rev_8_21_14_0_10_44_13]
MSNHINEICEIAFPSIKGIVDDHVQIAHDTLYGCGIGYPLNPEPPMTGFELILRKRFIVGDGPVKMEDCHRSKRKWEVVTELHERENLPYKDVIEIALRLAREDNLVVYYALPDNTSRIIFHPDNWEPRIG